MNTTATPTKAQMKAAETEAHRLDAKRTREAQAKLQERAGKPGGRRKKPMSFHDAAVAVLQEEGPLHVTEITKRMLERKLSTSSGKTPHATMATILLRGTRAKVFIKVGAGTFDLRELNPRGAKKRPAGS